MERLAIRDRDQALQEDRDCEIRHQVRTENGYHGYHG